MPDTTDHLTRVEAFLAAWPIEPIPGLDDADLIAQGVMAGDPDLTATTLAALVAEVKQLRNGLPMRVMRQAWRNGWMDRGQSVKHTVAESANSRDTYEAAFAAKGAEWLKRDEDDEFAACPECGHESAAHFTGDGIRAGCALCHCVRSAAEAAARDGAGGTGTTPNACTYYDRAGHTPDQKPHPRAYESGPDGWPLCPDCRSRVEGGMK